MSLQPWYKVVTPREDLRANRPLDASEFAVHLDKVQDGSAPAVYSRPEQFFSRTFLTQNLIGLAAEVVRRLSGEKTETSAVFNMTTQFGGGKTHALTLLYHLARRGGAAAEWPGVSRILARAGLVTVPRARTAIFVGQQFDPRGGSAGDGDDGTPKRQTPWGEIAWQLAGQAGYELMADFDEQERAPGGDTIGRLLELVNGPALILIDELVNYISRYRRGGLGGQTYHFVQNLSEEARARDRVVVAVALQASELEMSSEDHSDYQRLHNMLKRLGKAVILSAEDETAEIIRRRLFEWDMRAGISAVTAEGKVLLPAAAHETSAAYARWAVEHRQMLPGDFPVDRAEAQFLAAYPFHPALLSVFERKWQALPHFQRTRGILRLLALWVADAYERGFMELRQDALITLGSAPLDNPTFRAAVFEQLGEEKLEAAVTTDIAGRPDAHAIRLDAEANEAMRRARLHRQAATTIFFESNGGQTRAQATLPEIRLAVSEPGLDIGNVETALEALAPPNGSCFYLDTGNNRYWFSYRPNLTKVHADRRATISPEAVAERARAEVQKVFTPYPGLERLYFPERSSQITDRPALTLVILAPERSLQQRDATLALMENLLREAGHSARSYKNALIFALADNPQPLADAARNLLAWEAVRDESRLLHLDDGQEGQLAGYVRSAQGSLRESVWRSYNRLAVLGKDNALRVVDLGLVHSSAADSLTTLMIGRLRQDDDIQESISPNFLTRHWPPAFSEWSTKGVRDVFFASPQFPRLLNPEAIRDTIARGVQNRILAYVGKGAGGDYEPFYYGEHGGYLGPADVEISDEMYIITAETAERHIRPPVLSSLSLTPQQVQLQPGQQATFTLRGQDQFGRAMTVEGVSWSVDGGSVSPDGVFTAGPDEGLVTVTATAGDVRATALATIRKGATPGPGYTPPPPPGVRKLTWQGRVPAQMWMNFYMKVLSKFAAAQDAEMTLEVAATIEAAPGKRLSEHRIEETKVALREIGLSDTVTTTE